METKTISELVKKLEEVKAKYGDLEVWTQDEHYWLNPYVVVITEPECFLGESYEGKKVVTL